MPGSIVVGTAGHIDHGKSSLVLALTGIDPDRLKEEKTRGITIELGFAHAAIGDTQVAFVDVPGHERFVRTMLAGVGGIDCVLLVVAADESVMPQTREHFDICRLLRVPRGIVVITKSDLADVETRSLVKEELRELVRGTFLETAAVIEVSAVTGAGLDDLRKAIAVEAAAVQRRPIEGPARLPMDRAFSMKGFGTVVTGTLVSGRISADDELVILPGGLPVKVRGVQVHGRAAKQAQAGQRTAVNLGGVEVADVSRGETLAAPNTLSVTRRADAEIDLLPSAKPLKHGARVRLHHGTSEVLGRVSIAGTETNVPPGGRALVRVRFESAAVLTRGDRFILRAYSPLMTVGGGIVLDPAPTRPGIRTAEGRASLERLRPGADDVPAMLAMIDAVGLPGIERRTLVSRAGVPPAKLAAVVHALESREVVLVGDRLVGKRHLAKAADALVALVTTFHKANPMSEGVPREEARERVFARSAPAIFERVLEDLKARKAIAGADRLALPTHRVTVTGADGAVRDAILEAYRTAGLTPPDPAGVQAAAKAPAAIVEKVTTLLLREKLLVRLDTLIFHAEALQQLKADVVRMKTAAAGGRATVDVAAFKDRYGVTRKFAIPLLEYLDRERVTRRTGDVRLVL